MVSFLGWESSTFAAIGANCPSKVLVSSAFLLEVLLAVMVIWMIIYVHWDCTLCIVLSVILLKREALRPAPLE
jgi:hypothetical protein